MHLRLMCAARPKMLRLAIVLVVISYHGSNAQTRVCPHKPADIVFVVDGSGSEGIANFQKQLAFIQNFTGQFEIGRNKTQVSLVTFSSHVTNEFSLNTYASKADVISAIGRVHYPNGETYTNLALDYVRLHSLTHHSGSRDGVNKIVIVLTDGKSNEGVLTAQATALLKLNRDVTVVAIGIGNGVDPTELAAIASNKNHTFTVTSFDLLQTIHQDLTDRTCHTPFSTATHTTTHKPTSPTTIGTTTTTKPVCPHKPADIVFVVDGSGSEGIFNFQKQLAFIQNFTGQFEIGRNKTQVSLVTFSSHVTNEFSLNTYASKVDVLSAIGRVHYPNGETYTNLALDYVRLHSLTHHSGSRDGVNKIVIVLTDGKSNEGVLTAQAAALLKLNRDVTVVAIGIGNGVDPTELAAIASNKNHTFTVASFDLLQTIHQDLTDTTCHNVILASSKGPADIFFLLNSSGSEGTTNFRKQWEFANTVANEFDFGPDSTQIGLAMFGTAPFSTATHTTTHKSTSPTIIGTTTTTKPACGPKVADILFILDSSVSDGPANFKKILDFVYNFARHFAIGVNNVLFSLITYSSNVNVRFYFNTYTSRNSVLNAIQNTSYIGLGTNTSDALHVARTVMFRPEHGSRPNATKIAIVITDGRSRNPNATITEAAQLKKTADVFSIGIGPNVDQHELGAIASKPSNVMQVNSFELLHTIQDKITQAACSGRT